MSLNNIFNIAGSAMSAQSIRLNTTASNMANAETLAGSADKIYRAKEPVFATILKNGIVLIKLGTATGYKQAKQQP